MNLRPRNTTWCLEWRSYYKLSHTSVRICVTKITAGKGRPVAERIIASVMTAEFDTRAAVMYRKSLIKKTEAYEWN